MTVLTKSVGTATINPSVLATSHGRTGMDSPDELGSTSKGSFSGALGMREQQSSFGGMVVSVILVLMTGWMLFCSTTFNKYRVLIKLIYRKNKYYNKYFPIILRLSATI
jgi:hypothetical protein